MHNKRSRIFVVACAWAAMAAIGLTTGQWFIGLLMVVAVEAITAPRLSRCGVNSLGTLATATIVQEALELVFTVRPILNSISKGFTDVNGSPIAAFNQQVITRTLAIPAVQNFGSAASGRADVDVPVTLNQFKQLRYDFTPQEYSGTNRDLIRESAMPMAISLANYMVDAVAALWTVANFPTRTGADAVANGATSTVTVKGAGWDYSHLIDVRKVMQKAGVPSALPRFYAGNADVYGSMLADLRIVGYLNNQANQEAIRTGRLPKVAGFDLDEYPALPTTGNMVAFAGTPDSTVYAHRIPKDPREVPGFESIPIPGRLGVVTEPRTGLSVMVLEFVALPSLTITTMLLWMYGVAVGNANNGQLITSQ